MPSHILVVEDDSAVSANIKEILETVGYSVTVANNSEAALESAVASSPDLILMDINLGSGPDGIETAKKLNATSRRPLIYLSGNDDDASLERAQETGPLSYILKPFESRQLLSAIKMGIHQPRAGGQSGTEAAPGNASEGAQDSLTGLAGKPGACAYMSNALKAGKSVCATVFVVDRYAFACGRYGRQVADEIVSLYSVHLAQNLPSGNVLFSWDGPAFLAVDLENDEKLLRQARTKIAMMTRPPSPYYLQQQSRTALIPLGADWSTFFSSPQEKPGEIVDKIDRFVATHYQADDVN